MKTPIADFVKKYADSGAVRLHMPGHKGRGVLGVESLDITEINGADVLSETTGIIGESEKNAASLFGAKRTFYSTEGSTLCIKAMLGAALLCAPKSKARPFVLAARNVHKAFVYACALLDLDVKWIYPDKGEHLCKCTVTAEKLKAELCKEKPIAVYITSPDYLGNVANIAQISAVCKASDVPLLVDNAHGAYLRFLNPSRHPLDLGADMCCDSAHKTLPVLTGGAYLHISSALDDRYVVAAGKMLALNSSTSPSYLILQSLDLCNRRLSESFSAELEILVKKLERFKHTVKELGFEDESDEPLKVTVNASKVGITGTALADTLRSFNIESEFYDEQYLVLMASPDNTDEDFETLTKAFERLKPKAERVTESITIETLEQVTSIREAVLCDSETVSVENALGRVCASVTVSCPPAVPIAVSGERINANTVELFKKYGIKTIDVIK